MNAAQIKAALVSPSPDPSGATCCRCGRWTYLPVPVRYIPRPSSAGVTLYACPDHAVPLMYGPGPATEEL